MSCSVFQLKDINRTGLIRHVHRNLFSFSPSIKADLKELYTFCRSPCLLSERHRSKTKIMIWPRIKTADYLTPINTFLKGFLHSSMYLRLNIHRENPKIDSVHLDATFSVAKCFITHSVAFLPLETLRPD